LIRSAKTIHPELLKAALKIRNERDHSVKKHTRDFSILSRFHNSSARASFDFCDNDQAVPIAVAR